MGQESTAPTEDAGASPAKRRKDVGVASGEVVAGRLRHLPESVAYSGTYVIELPIPRDMFSENLRESPDPNHPVDRTPLPLKGDDGGELQHGAVKLIVEDEINAGFAGSQLFPGAQDAAVDPEAYEPLRERLTGIKDEIASMLQKELRLNVFRAAGGELAWNYLPEPEYQPRLLLVHTYQLTTHLGGYGPGRTLSTFTLLPGEETEIAISTYRSSKETSRRASSVFDSFNTHSASELQTEVQVEHGSRASAATNFEYNVSGQAQACWGWGSASISAGVCGGVSTATEAFARSVSNAVDRHASVASSQRDVHINTSGETTTMTEWSEATKRKLQNPNQDLALNFVFRQLNQEFITLLSLVDVRVAYFDGYGEHRREVELHELDDLLADVIGGARAASGTDRGITVLPRRVAAVRSTVLEPLWRITDYRGRQVPLIEEASYERPDGRHYRYVRVRKDLESEYASILQTQDGDGDSSLEKTAIHVPGIIVRATRNILRTDAVVVDCLLGAATAHGDLARETAEAELQRHAGAKTLLDLRAQRERVAQRIIRDKDEIAASIYATVFGSLADPSPSEEARHER